MTENEHADQRPAIHIEAPGFSYADMPWLSAFAARMGQPDREEKPNG